MTAIVFIGPTISSDEVRNILDAVCLPPAAQGDVYRAMSLKPRCIGIIDGYFDGVAAVWHKEILWALAQGVHVFGASSMGALRACELDVFGMRGVGRIYEDYRDGKIENDDDVAITHGPAELNYPALSETLANIRATLQAATAAKIISRPVMNSMLNFANELNYRDRGWEKLFGYAARKHPGQFDDIAFRGWVEKNHQNQKRLDALDLLAEMRRQLETDDQPHQACFEFEWTTQWDRAVRQWERQAVRHTRGQVFEDASHSSISPDLVVDELRLRPDLFAPARDAAMARLLALRPVRLEDDTIDGATLAGRLTSFRQKRNLFTRAAMDDWLQQNDLTTDGLEAILAQDALASRQFPLASGAFRQQLVNQMKLEGTYAKLAGRARDKADAVDQAGQETRPPPLALLDWYFRKNLHQQLPENLDIYAQNLGLTDRKSFYTLLNREFLFLRTMDNKATTGKDRGESDVT